MKYFSSSKIKHGLIFLAFLFSNFVHAQDFMMQAWYWDYPKTATGANWVGTLQGQAAALNGKFNYMWLPPLAKPSFGNSSNGYDPKDLYDYGEFNNGCPWGNRSGLNSLISTYNNNNIKTVADVVYNHRDGGRAENNPAVENYVTNFTGNGAPFPSDRMRCVLPLGTGTLNGAGDYYIKFSSKTGNTANYGNKPYKVYVQTKKTGWQSLPDGNEAEPNGGGDCSQTFNTITLGRNFNATTDGSGCATDEFKITLTANDIFPTDTLFIYFSNQNGQYSDHRPYGLWSAARNADVISEVKYQTYTDFSGLPSGQGAMNYQSFKPNGTNPTNLTGEQDGMYFFYDYEQANTTCQNVLNDWTKWNWNTIGIRGFRMDAVKHFPASYVSQLMNNLNSQGINPGMVVGESFDFDANTLKNWVNAVQSGMTPSAQSNINIKVFDFALRGALKNACDGFGYDVRNVYTSGIVEGAGASGFNSVTFVNNHDFRDAGQPVQNDPKLAYAYILTNNRVGTPCVFYPDYYGTTIPNAPTVNLQSQIDQLINIHKQHIFGSNQLDYLNKEGSGTLNGSNYISAGAGASKTTTQIYQIKGGASGRDIIVAINYAGTTLKVDHQINGTGNPQNTQFTDLLGNSAFPTANVDAQGRIYIELPPRSYSVWLRQSGQAASPVSVVLSNQTNVSCNGGNNGAATVAATGGSGCTMSYLWSNGQTGATASNLSAGTYTAIATCGTQTGSYIVTITQPSSVTVSTGAIQLVTCANAGSTTATATGGTSPFSYLWSNGQTNATVSAVNSGLYTVTATDSKNCKKTLTVNIGANQTAPPSQIQASNTLTCSNTNATLTPQNTSANYTYLWSNGSNTSSTSVNQTGTYSLSVTDNTNGCTSTSSYNLTSNTTVPNAVISNQNPTLTCANPNVTLNASASTGTGTLSYLWTGTGITVGATTAQATVNQAGTFTVKVTDNANGCFATKQISVASNTTPTSVSAVGGTVTCSNPSLALSASATPNGATYQWAGPNNFSSTLQNPVVIGAGTYSVTATGSNGCTAVAAAIVTGTGALVPPTIQGNTSFCSGTSTILSIGQSYASYLWSNNSTANNISVNTGGNYSVTVTDANGCKASSSQTLTSTPLPTVNFANQNPIISCANSNLVLDASSSTGAAPLTFNWSGNGITAGATSAQATVNQAGTYNVTVTGNGCSSSKSITVTANSTPTSVTATGGTITCSQISLTLSANATPSGATYQWAGPNNFSSNLQNPIVTASGTYSVTATGSNGCKGTAAVIVTTDNAAPTPTIQGSATLCNGTNTVLSVGQTYNSYVWSGGGTAKNKSINAAGTYTVTVTAANGCTGVASQTVTLGQQPVIFIINDTLDCIQSSLNINATSPSMLSASTWTGPNNFTANVLTPTVVNPGVYTLTATTTQGCSQQFLATIYQSPNVPQVSIAGNAVICDGGTTTLTAISTQNNYLWNNGSTSNSITTSAAGNYQVTVSNAQGCKSAASVQVVISAAPDVKANDVKVCQGSIATLNAIVTNTNSVSYSWTNNGVFNSSSQNITFNNVLPSNAGTYYVAAINSAGCIGRDTAILSVSPKMTISLTPNYTCNTASVTANITGGISAFQYEWSGSTLNAGTVFYNTPATVNVTVTDAFACKSNNALPLNLAAAVPLTASEQISAANNGNNGAINLTVTGGVQPISYQWTNGATSEDLNNLAVGQYCVTILDAVNCGQIKCFTVSSSVGLEDQNLAKAISVFPNPTEDFVQINIKGEFSLSNIQLFDDKGRLLQKLKGDVRQIDMSQLPNAIYLLRLESADGFVTKRITKLK